MKKLSKLKLYDFQEMNEVEMKNVVGGRVLGSGVNDCPSGKAPCTCNGTYYGCKTLQECWDAC